MPLVLAGWVSSFFFLLLGHSGFEQLVGCLYSLFQYACSQTRKSIKLQKHENIFFLWKNFYFLFLATYCESCFEICIFMEIANRYTGRW